MNTKVRVRFAPSPTGPMHIGSVRTALFNYLFAKKHQGDFILRIEDTDQSRYVEGSEDYLIEALNWCGIPYDEGPGKEGHCGPYRQSERKHLYHAYARTLLEKGKAYYAFDTPEQLETYRKDYEAQGKTFIYNAHNRMQFANALSLSATEVQQKLEAGAAYVIRFKIPQDEVLVLNDVIRGEIKIDTNTLDDKVLFKSDGMPTYHLANIVDDHLMEITHVIRGEEWLPSLALHQLLYKAFEWTAPQFAHLPLILKPVGQGKLSKRDGEKGGFPVFPLSWKTAQGYREAGYFPETVVNFLALLGWNLGTEQELFALEELVQAFSLERINKSGARFDPEKTKWYNQQWLQRKSDTELTALFAKALAARSSTMASAFSKMYLEKVVSLIKMRASFVSDFWDLSHYFFEAPTAYDEKAVQKHWKEETLEIMRGLMALLEDIEDFTAASVETRVKVWIAGQGFSFGKVMPPLRLLLVGAMKGPHVFDILALLGKAESLQRIKKALTLLPN